MKTFCTVILSTFIFGLSPTGLNASEEVKKVAIVDMSKLFNEYNLTKATQEKVKVKQAVIQEENNKKLEEVRGIADEIKTLSKQIEDPVTSKKNKEELINKRQILANKGNALENNRREWLSRRNRAINENIVGEMSKILIKIQNKVENYAQDNNLDMVFDKSAQSGSSAFFLLFAKDQFDVTDQLLTALNNAASTPDK